VQLLVFVDSGVSNSSCKRYNVTGHLMKTLGESEVTVWTDGSPPDPVNFNLA